MQESLYWELLTLYGKTFQVQGIHWLTALIWDREVEESPPLAGIVLFIKTLEITGFGICLCM